jgi:hypothetical protein
MHDQRTDARDPLGREALAQGILGILVSRHPALVAPEELVHELVDANQRDSGEADSRSRRRRYVAASTGCISSQSTVGPVARPPAGQGRGHLSAGRRSFSQENVPAL